VSSGVTKVERYEHGGTALIDEVFGNAAPRHMIFMHGWGGSRESLRGIGSLFQQSHRIHLIDLPGFGEAPLPPQDWDTVRYTDLVHQYLVERVDGPVMLVGHSFGGKVALRLASRRLPQIQAMALLAVPGLQAPVWSRTRIRRSGIRALRRLLTAMRGVTGPGALEWHTRRFGSKDYLAAGELRSLLVKSVNEDLTEAARAVACPVLLLWGADDRDTPPWLAERYQLLMNGHSTLELLPHQDHHLNTGTGAHLCAHRIRYWLEHGAGRTFLDPVQRTA